MREEPIWADTRQPAGDNQSGNANQVDSRRQRLSVGAEVQVKRALKCGDATTLAKLLAADPAISNVSIAGVPLLLLLGRSIFETTPDGVHQCARLLLDAGADPDSYEIGPGGGYYSALYHAIGGGNLEVAQLLIDRGATLDEDAFELACIGEEFNPPGDHPFVDLFLGRARPRRPHGPIR